MSRTVLLNGSLIIPSLSPNFTLGNYLTIGLVVDRGEGERAAAIAVM